MVLNQNPQKNRVFHIFANAALGKGLSGGDRIFIEFAKRLRLSHKVVIHVWREGWEMCQRQNLKDGVTFKLINVDRWCKLGFIPCYFSRIIKAIWSALFLKLDNDQDVVLYSASEFWMDCLPAFILKLRFLKVRWIAGWFQTAPNPLIGFASGKREKTYKLSAFYHWFMQFPIKPLIERWADFVLVNNEEEKKYFPHLNKQRRTAVILGAVNIEEIDTWRQQHDKADLKKIYTAVFQGRFHPQKGVVELIDIWKKVTEKIPNAKLVMIGDGPLMENVKLQITNYKLQKNIKLFGWVFDGPEKYRIFSKSKLVVHPAFYDSGGMASAEAMAFGIPCVGFNLDSYKSYYPKGMVKVKVGDLDLFANTIVELIKSNHKREKIGKEAQKMIQENWSWDQRVDSLLTLLDTG